MASATQPATDRPLGRTTDPPPDRETDRALRYTWCRGFQNSGAVESLETVAALVLSGAFARPSTWKAGDMSDELAAAADDLASLATYLGMTVKAAKEVEAGEDELCRQTQTWEARLRCLVGEIRLTVGGDSEEAEARTAAARSILEDLAVLVDRARKAVGQRRADPESRGLRQAMAGALALLVQAETLLEPAVGAEGADDAE
jgi:hypothetical protein